MTAQTETLPSRRGHARRASWHPSPALSEVLERLRGRLGITFEVLTAGLDPVIPEAGGEFHRSVNAAERRRVAAEVATGRSTKASGGTATFAVEPLRSPGRTREVFGVVAVRADHPSDDASERWADVLRAMVEADFDMTAEAVGEQARTRHCGAVLKFVGELTAIDTQADLMRAVVDAAAVWFDADARVYYRDLRGDLALHTHLPGVTVGSRRLNSVLVGTETRSLRVSTAESIDDLRWGAPEVVLVPLCVEGPQDWVIAAGGTLPPSADEVFQVVGSAVATQLRQLIARQRASVRARIGGKLFASNRSADWLAMAVLRDVMEMTSAAGAVLTLHDQRGARRLGAFGARIGETAPAMEEPLLAPEQMLWPIQLGGTTSAVLELRAREDAVGFTPSDALVVEEAAEVIGVWLTGVLRSFLDSPASGISVLDVDDADAGTAFLQRIREELERAKRFDLALSVLLIDLAASASATPDPVRQVVENVRRELRGSDILGLLGPGRIAVLLLHTDVRGTLSVLPRIRHRLRTLADAAGLSSVTLGRAALSRDCRTVAALLTQASRDIEAIAAN
jgi:GGDEF domain-containing protein